MSRSRKFVAAAVIAFTLLFSFVVAQNHPQVPIRNVSLSVFDAKGKRVGKVLDLGGQQAAIVAFEVSGHPAFVLSVLSAGMEGGSFLFFESTNCSGTAFLQPRDRALVPTVAVASPGSTVYLQDPIGTPRTINARSQLVSPDIGGSCQTFGGPTTIIGALPAMPEIDLNNVFTPPFSIRATK